MEIGLHKVDNVMVLTIKGRADALNVSKIEAFHEQIAENNIQNLILDCTQLEYVSSAALRIFLKMAKQVKKVSGKFVMASNNELVRKIFEISGLPAIFPSVESLQDALNCFKK